MVSAEPAMLITKTNSFELAVKRATGRQLYLCKFYKGKSNLISQEQVKCNFNTCCCRNMDHSDNNILVAYT